MEDILEILLFIFVEIAIVWTGEIVKFVLSFGRYTPTFDRSESFCNSSSFFVGISFWIVIGVIVAVILSSGGS